MNAFVDLSAPFALVVLLTGVLFYWMPRLTRPDLYFAVTVAADFRDSAAGRALLSRYRLKVVLASLPALAVPVFGALRNSPALLLAAVIVQQAGTLLAYFAARSQVKPYATEPTPVREAALSPRDARIPGGWLAKAGPFAILAATGVYLRLHWSAIPERFPVHWGIDGQPNAWATRTEAGVYGPLLIAAATCLLLGGVAYGVLHASRPIRLAGAPGQAESRFRSTVAGIVVGAEYLMGVVFSWTALLPLTHSGSGAPSVWGVLMASLLFPVVAVVLLVRLGQGGTRAAQAGARGSLEGETRPVGDRTQDRYWKAGLLYVNSEDPALFVEKRFGIGYTLNFGRPASWVMLTALLLVPVVIALVVKWGSR
jgi:uncharacterized membrane protein